VLVFDGGRLFLSDSVTRRVFSAADDNFFSRIKSNSLHVLQPYLPDNNDIPYQLRARSHTLALINTRMLCYRKDDRAMRDI